MDLTPKCTEESKPAEQVVETLQNAAIIYPAYLLEGLPSYVQAQIWPKIYQIKPEDIVSEKTLAFPVSTREGEMYIGFAISMVDVNTARIWEIGEISLNQFLDFVSIKRAIL